MKTALVTGSNGFVGSQLCRELLNNGYHVRAMHRGSSRLELLRGLDCEHVIGDITDRESLEKNMKNVDVVFHIAALFREAKFTDEVYFQVNAQGTRNVFEIAEKLNIPKVIHCSTTGVMSEMYSAVDETHPKEPGDVYQESKLEAEEIALEFYKSARVQGCVIRPAMIWGENDTRFLKLFKGIANKKMPLIGNGKTLFHFIYVKDLARAFRLAAESDKVNGEVFIIAGDRPVSIRYVYETIAKHFNVDAPKFNIPFLPVYAASFLVNKFCVILGVEPPIHPRRVKFFVKTRAFNTAKAKELLGFESEKTFEDEVKIISEGYRKNAWL